MCKFVQYSTEHHNCAMCHVQNVQIWVSIAILDIQMHGHTAEQQIFCKCSTRRKTGKLVACLLLCLNGLFMFFQSLVWYVLESIIDFVNATKISFDLMRPIRFRLHVAWFFNINEIMTLFVLLFVCFWNIEYFCNCSLLQFGRKANVEVAATSRPKPAFWLSHYRALSPYLKWA